jgi:hypothetical protein
VAGVGVISETVYYYCAEDLNGSSVYVSGSVSLEGLLGGGISVSFGRDSSAIEYNVSSGLSVAPADIETGVSESRVTCVFTINRKINELIKFLFGFNSINRKEN